MRPGSLHLMICATRRGRRRTSSQSASMTTARCVVLSHSVARPPCRTCPRVLARCAVEMEAELRNGVGARVRVHARLAGGGARDKASGRRLGKWLLAHKRMKDVHRSLRPHIVIGFMFKLCARFVCTLHRRAPSPLQYRTRRARKGMQLKAEWLRARPPTKHGTYPDKSTVRLSRLAVKV